ncbi:25435_t:CDS:2, partial [Gigaspora rosea]
MAKNKKKIKNSAVLGRRAACVAGTELQTLISEILTRKWEQLGLPIGAGSLYIELFTVNV